MFQGETAVTLDDKGRVAIPVAYRELVAQTCGNRLVVTYNPFEPGCLWIFPHQVWEPLRNQVNALSKTVQVHRVMQMKLVGAAALVEPDGNGRILLPASQRSATAIEKRAVLLGMGDKFELWGEQAHAAKIREPISEEQITEAMHELAL